MREDARLGGADDHLLLAAIDLAIHRRHPAYSVKISRWQKARPWVLAAAAVVAVSTVSVLTLRQIMVPETPGHSPHLIVSLLPEEGVGTAPPAPGRSVATARMAEMRPVSGSPDASTRSLPFPRLEAPVRGAMPSSWNGERSFSPGVGAMPPGKDVAALAGVLGAGPDGSEGWKSPGQSPQAPFPLQVETASWDRLASHVLMGAPLRPETIRSEELVNALPYGLKTPHGTEAFAVTAEVASCPWAENHRLLLVGICGHDTADLPEDLLIQVRFDGQQVVRYRLLGQSSALGQGDSAGRVSGAWVRRQIVALYEIEPPATSQGGDSLASHAAPLATVALRHALADQPGGHLAMEVPVQDSGAGWHRASGDFRAASAACWLGAALRGERGFADAAQMQKLRDLGASLPRDEEKSLRLALLGDMIAKVTSPVKR